MIALGLIALIVLLLAMAYATTRSPSTGGEVRERSIDRRDIDATPDLQRWVEAGLLTDSQMRGILEFESGRRPTSEPTRVTPVVEALAYVGGILLAIGAAMLVGRFWDRMGTAAHLVVVMAVGVVTGAVGTVVGESDPVAWRLRGFLWALCAGGFGASAGLFVFEVLDRTGEPVAFTTAMTIAIVSVLLWRLRNRPLQHLLTFLGLVVAVGVAIAWTGSDDAAAWVGAAFWTLGLLWAGSSWMHRLPPAVIGFVLGVVLTMVGAGAMSGTVDWLGPTLGLVTAIGWCAVGVSTDEVLALLPGVVGVFVFLPWTLGRLAGESLGAPVIMMISGLTLLAVVAFLVRRPHRRGTAGDGIVRGHFRRSFGGFDLGIDQGHSGT